MIILYRKYVIIIIIKKELNLTKILQWFFRLKNLRFAFDVNLSHEDIKISYLTRINKIIINMFPRLCRFYLYI